MAIKTINYSMEEIEKFHFFVKTNFVSTKASEKITWVILCLYLQRLPFRIENTAGFLCEEDILKTKFYQRTEGSKPKKVFGK